MKINTPAVLCLSLFVGACADSSADVQPTYVSPLNFQRYSCGQIEQEARRVAARAAQVAGVQDQNAESDAVATGVALVLFWPAAFFVGGNKANAAELGRLRGELDALEQASIQKGCGIEFRAS